MVFIFGLEVFFFVFLSNRRFCFVMNVFKIILNWCKVSMISLLVGKNKLKLKTGNIRRYAQQKKKSNRLKSPILESKGVYDHTTKNITG